MSKLLVVGAGAVGAYYAAMATKHNPGVVLLARGESYEVIRRDGIKVIITNPSPGVDKTEETVKVETTNDASTVSQSEYVMLASKMYDIESSLEQLRGPVSKAKGVFGIQNGIEKEDMIAKYTGNRPLYCTTQVGCDRIAPGVIRHSGARRKLFIGEADNGKTPRVAEITSMLNCAEIDCVAPDDIQLQLWLKFIGISGLAGVCSAAMCDGGQANSYEPTRMLLQAVQKEGWDVAAAHCPSITPQMREQAMANSQNRPRSTGGPSHIPSMAADYMSGRRTEVEYLNGAMVRKAKEKGIAVPVHEFLYAVISSPKYKE